MRREQTRAVRQMADAVEQERYTLALLAEADLPEANLGDIDTVAGRAERAAALAARNAAERAVGGTKTCLAHAARAEVARAETVDLAATVRRRIESERLRREEETYARREMIERDYPALAPLVDMDPVRIERALALAEADDYKAVDRALSEWAVATRYVGDLPAADRVTPFITEDTDARELAGVIVAYYGAAPDESLDEVRDGVTWENVDPEVHPGLAAILAAAHAAGWRAPGVAFGDDPDHAAMLAGGGESAVYGGGDDYVVAEAAALAIGRHGVFDDTGSPEDHGRQWWAWIVPGVPVWLPHVEAWRRDMPTHDETLMMRQMNRASEDWETWGRDTYLCAYVERYAEEIIRHESPPTLGEEWDTGHDPGTFAEVAAERAEKVAEQLHVGLSDVTMDSDVPHDDEIVEVAERDARDDYREAHQPRRPEGMAPLF